MLDLINQIRRTNKASMDRDNRTVRPTPKISAFDSLKGKWRTLRREKRLCDEWLDFDLFHQWFEAQPKIASRYYIITPNPLLPPGTKGGPDTMMVISKGLFEYLTEFRLIKNERLPVGVRSFQLNEVVQYGYTVPGGSTRVGGFKDPLECQMGWLQARIEFVERYCEEHKDSKNVLELLAYFQARLRYHIEHKLEYHVGNWRNQ